MAFHHAFYTLAYLFSVDAGRYLFDFFAPLSPFFAGTFVLISGTVSNLSRSNLKRGLKLIAVSLIISFVTIIFIEGEEIYFGILHMLAVCMILYSFLKKPMLKIPAPAGIAASIFLFFITYPVTKGLIGFNGLLTFELPGFLYSAGWLFPLGFTSSGFYSADYFPLFPWFFMFLAGGFIGRYASEGRFPKFMFKKRIPPLGWLGRHSLAVYVLHQPVIFGIFYLIENFM